MLCVLREVSRNFSLCLEFVNLDAPLNDLGSHDVDCFEGVKASFRYPSGRSAAMVDTLSTTTDHTFPWSTVPFTTAPNDEIVMSIRDAFHETGWCFVTTVPLEIFLSHLRGLPNHICGHILEWEDWGYNNGSTHMLDLPVDSFCSIQGSKVLVTNGPSLQFYDLHRPALRRRADDSSKTASTSNTQTLYHTLPVPMNPYWTTFVCRGCDTVLPCKTHPIMLPTELGISDEVVLAEDGVVVVRVSHVIFSIIFPCSSFVDRERKL